MNPKEQFMSALRNDQPPKWMGYAFNAFPQSQFHVVLDPISVWDILSISGDNVLDNWGVNHRFLPGDPGIIPMVNEQNKVIKDVTKWRDYVHFPEIPELDWSDAKKTIDAIDRNTTMVMVPTFRGLFERAHCLMTFEDVLIYMYEEPEAMYELFGAYTDWKLKVAEQLIDNLHPDIIHSHDDWGSKTSLFFSPQKFRELLMPHYERLYGYMKKRGVLIQHHADCYCTGIEKDMVDLGIDMWQGVLPSNDIPLIQKNTGGKLLLMGGLEQGLIDQADVTEDIVRAEVRRAIDAYAPGGAFLPCIGSLECLNAWVTPVVIDECNRYGAEWLKKHQ
ncbi:Uroporphyrinogen decarboxylase (URO-D) [Sporobacter termitidis DSM 10068]|uniref:Uroporphyrinogen decarboxylase (URO-D) n=1 Tax=Sporobacter termitidis DSM 10068 TaxID=1123282 RepID=A0A1M5Y7Y4_9FIRM|nr:uroporphyrinogen decarboxylase family protein [Sporobacter termitidis]SHI07918.1 Uroporphyrinogen decarboxylase (URO-D) [Sporobacter termitidis DSM 10068]